MTPEITVGVLSLIGTLIGSLGGILAANKLITYRIEQLEKKVDKHNQVVERFVILEESVKTHWKQIDELKMNFETLRKEIMG